MQMMLNRYKYKDGKREHLHTWDEKPLIGCTTALSVFGKQGLVWWASGKALEPFGWAPLNKTKDGVKIEYGDKGALAVREVECFDIAKNRFEEIRNMTPETYFALLKEGYKAHSVFKKAKAKEGTDAHEMCELWIKSVIAGKEIVPDPHIVPFVNWCRENVRKFLWSELHMVSETMWTGGICDVGFIDKNGLLVVGDIKNRDQSYATDLFQCGGYDLMVTEQKGGFDADGNRILTIDQPVKVHMIFPLIGFKEPAISYNVAENRNAFRHAVELYKAFQFIEKGAK